MDAKTLSVIVPARNEEAMIGATLDALLDAVGALSGRARPHLDGTPVEIVVADNESDDRTPEIVAGYGARYGVRLLTCPGRRAPCARNAAVRHTRGRVLVFVDADTLAPRAALRRVLHWVDARGYEAGFLRLAPRERAWRARAWWWFWGEMRRLPLARAKAMPAFMFCTRAAFHEFGPFDEQVIIGEEWPILAGLYRARPGRLVYDRELAALTSSRRMDLQRFGYARTFFKYVWAVLHASGRNGYAEVRHAVPAPAPVAVRSGEGE